MDLLLILKALILGVVEGATEFLPISSTGHLIIVGDWLNFNDEKGKVFEIVIQLAAILAVCWEYRRKLIDTALQITTQSKAQQFVLNLFLAFLPAAILGLAFHSFIKEYLFSPITVAIALLIGGFAILFIENQTFKTPTVSIDDLTPNQAFKVGLAQSLALFPGISRAGATILGGMIFGLNRKTATEFSFFLAIPIMFAATVLDVYKSRSILSFDDIGMFAAGFVTAFLSALIAIRFLLKFVASHDFKVFAWYRIIFGAVVLAYYWH
ncbi:MAG: undecaprenyl-diphosphate phosphatase [Methylotenera sp.]|uniref:undecaprenyl-diphosphate phosphatase n=1 Tax=Methylotenera sp. TaxID=2051956 RepID=UPI002487B32C|nr:undecaprenyl-diphosphate phosphatase [Methylotenera sp.]MDI1308896.1 undecaprenyl-diphosphate phosphatase [Methylotenera sp.]